MTSDSYQTLGVSKDASRDDIRKAYYKLVMKYHPDRHPLRRDEYEKRMQLINTAYNTIARQRRWKKTVTAQSSGTSNDNRQRPANQQPSWFSEIIDLFRSAPRPANKDL